MADDTSRNSEPEIVRPAGAGAAPPSREPRPDPSVIEGEAKEIHEVPPSEPTAAEPTREEPAQVEPAAPEAAQEEPVAESSADANAPEIHLRKRSLRFPFVALALGAVVGAAIALGAAFLLDPRAAALNAASAQLAALERGAEAQSAANGVVDKRLAALEASEAGAAKAAVLEALGRRLAALEGAAGHGEAAGAALEEARAARAEAAKALALAAGGGQATAPAQGGAAASFDAGALEARIGRLESETAGLKSAGADLGALGDRIAKLEGALAAPKSEARVAPAEVAPGRDGLAQAIVAISLNQRLNAGTPFAPEMAALARLGADEGKLSALRPLAEAGAPTLAALGASFAKIAPGLVAAAEPPSGGGVMDRLIEHMRKLVRVRKVGEVAGDDAEALASRIAAALARGDLSAALEAYRRLPDAAQQAGRDWAKAAEAREAAGAAAEGLRADAIGRLAAAKN